jgi:hypothetical protein
VETALRAARAGAATGRAATEEAKEREDIVRARVVE